MKEMHQALARWAGERPGCRLLVLFGSGATGGERRESDADLALSFDDLPDPDERLRYRRRLAEWPE